MEGQFHHDAERWIMPSLSTSVLATVTISLAASLLRCLYNLLLHPLARFPGPKLRAASDLPYIWSHIRGTAPQDQLKLHKRYGPVVRVAPNELTFNGARAYRDIYGNGKGRGELSKDRKYYDGLGDTLLTSDQSYHAHIRRLLAPGFSDSALQKQQVALQGFVDDLMQQLEVDGDGGKKAVDLVEWFNFFSFDVISFLTYGHSSECLTSTTLHGWVHGFRNLGRPLSLAQAAARLPKVFRYPFLVLALPRSLRADRDAVYNISQQKVNQRLQMEQPKTIDFMAKLIDEYVQGRMSAEQLNNNAMFLMAAGSETLATILEHLTYQLVVTPRALKRAREEVRSQFDCPAEITSAKVNECKYLWACIQEALRIQPPSPATHPRYTPPGRETIIDGVPIPGDVAVGIPIYAACRSPSNFRNPDAFVPERWIGEDATYDADIKEASQVFSVGPRDCLGRNLAYVELKMVMARLLWQFDLEQCFPSDWADQKVFLVWEKTPLMVKLHPAHCM